MVSYNITLYFKVQGRLYRCVHSNEVAIRSRSKFTFSISFEIFAYSHSSFVLWWACWCLAKLEGWAVRFTHNPGCIDNESVSKNVFAVVDSLSLFHCWIKFQFLHLPSWESDDSWPCHAWCATVFLSHHLVCYVWCLWLFCSITVLLFWGRKHKPELGCRIYLVHCGLGQKYVTFYCVFLLLADYKQFVSLWSLCHDVLLDSAFIYCSSFCSYMRGMFMQHSAVQLTKGGRLILLQQEL